MNNVVSMPRKLDSSDEADVTIEGYQPLIPDSEYIVTFLGHESVNYRGQLKAVLRFSILHPEEWAGIVLRRYYNVEDHNGKLVAAPGSDLAREYRRVCGGRHRLDRLSFRRLKNKRIRAKIVTVATNWKGDRLEDYSQYSKIEELLGIEELDDWTEEYDSASEDG